MIIRREHRRNYTTLGNEVVDDARLSYEALGLLTYLLSRPDDWEVNIDQLRARTKIGRAKIYRIAAELQHAGYLTHTRVYESGKVKYGYWTVREEPSVITGKRKQISTPNHDLDLRAENRDEGADLDPENLRLENLRLENRDDLTKTHRYQNLTDTKEREGARAQGEKAALNLKPIIDGKPEEALAAIERYWPPGAVGNRAKALGLLADMVEADRKTAVDAAPRYLRALKDEKRRYTPAIETFLADGTWERFPPPKMPDGVPGQSVNLKPWVRPLWALLARRYAAGKSIADVSGWLRNGMVLPTLYLPSEDEEKALVAVLSGMPEAAEWVEHMLRLGARLPVPDSAPMWLPSLRPKSLSMRWNGYRLIEPALIEIRSPGWWWRLYAENAPIAELMAERGVGRVEITTGPIPLGEEVAAMVRIDVEDETWPAWELWFSVRRVRLLPLGGFIYAPARHPDEAFPPVRDATPDYEAFEAVGGER